MSEKASTSPLSQAAFVAFFKFVVACDTLRFKHPVWFSLIAGAIVFGIMVPVTQWIPFSQFPRWWTAPTPHLEPGGVLRWVTSLVVSLVLTQPIARQLLPLLFYVPQAIAMKNLGLMYVITDRKEQAIATTKCRKEHDTARKEKVKVICISGRYLFREAMMPIGKESPLP